MIDIVDKREVQNSIWSIKILIIEKYFCLHSVQTIGFFFILMIIVEND